MSPANTEPATTAENQPNTGQWSDLIGHEQIRNWFAAAIQQGRFGGSMLFVGSPGSGKRTVAKLIAKTLLCENVPARDMAPCGVCNSCIQVEADTHVDVIRVSKPADKSTIPLEKLIGKVDARMQEGFCHDIQLKPLIGQRKIAILEDADFLNEEGANCLLKTLEEPPADAVILVIGTVEQQQLPTIRSRCRIIRFSLNNENAKRLLREVHQIEANEEQLDEAIEIAGGNMHAAKRLLDPEANEFRDSLLNFLRAQYPDPVKISRVLNQQIDSVGKDAKRRRHALRDALSIAVQHFRRTMRSGTYAEKHDAENMIRLDRSVRAIHELDRNANQATLIECYAADIAAGVTGERGGIG